MKKLALSVAVAAIAATGVQAKTVYEDDQMSLSLTGEYAFEVVRDTDEDDSANYKTDNMDLEIHADYNLENGITVFGEMLFEFAGYTEKDESYDPLADHWVGFKKDGLEVRYGEQDYAVDDFGIDEQKDADRPERKNDVLGEDDADDKSAEVLVVEYSADSYYLAASADLPEKSSTVDDLADETDYSFYGEVDLADFTVGAVLGIQDQDGEDGDDAMTSYGASVEYTGVDDLKLGAMLVYNSETEDMAFDTSVEYDITKSFDIAAGVGMYLPEDDSEDEITYYYANVDYDFHKDVDGYAEVYGNSDDDQQLGFVVGISLDF